jgi:hypothetical protein
MRSATTPPIKEQEDGNAAEKLVGREQAGGVAQAVNQPTLGYDLHPGADAGGAGAEPHQAEIAILESLEDATKLRRFGEFCGFGGWGGVHRKS